MELEEMKKTWSALDNRLKENNSLNERIIREIAENKVEKTVKKLLRGEIIGSIVILLIIPYIIHTFRTDFLSIKLLSWVILTTAIIAAFWEIYKVSVLAKIDLSNNVKTNIYLVNRYKISIKWEYFSVIYIIIPLFFILSFLYYTKLGVGVSLWAFFASVFIVAIIAVWYSKKELIKSFRKIQESLEEIKDLKEE